MADTYVTREHHSFGSRLKGSLGGILFGLLLFLAGFPLLFWNEGRAVKTAQALEEGAGAVVDVAADRVDPAMEGKLVHLSGLATTTRELADPIFGVSKVALRLNREVEMYQWTESSSTKTEKKLGGGEEVVTTYTYDKKWTEGVVDSSRFAQPEGHRNPSTMPYRSESSTADEVTVGAFRLNPSQVARTGHAVRLPVDQISRESADQSVRESLWIDADGTYRIGDLDAPLVGDLRIGFTVVEPAEVSIVALQSGGTFAPYVARSGYEVDLLRDGVVSAGAMFSKAQSDNTVMTWVLRVAGLVMMWIGLSMIARPLVVVADVIPFLGSLVGMGTGFFAFVIALPSALVTIAVAWLFYRPLVGGALLAAGVAILVWGTRRAGAQKSAAPVPPPPPPPPLPDQA